MNKTDKLLEQQQAERLMKNWHAVQNGKRLDIHAIIPEEARELTIAIDVKNLRVANLMAQAPKFKKALERIVSSAQLKDGETPDPRAQTMCDIACEALGLGTETSQSEANT